MSFWDGSFTPAKREWIWEERRVYNPQIRCHRSNKRVFLRKAYRGRLYIDWTFQTEIWLSKEHYLWKMIKEG